MPKHFYYPIPPSNNLSKYNFDSQFPTTGLSIDDNIMKNLMYKIREYNEEYKPIYKSSGYESNGDGSILWGMIRIFKPNLIVEVGSGNSTRVALNAMDLNNQEKAKLGGVFAIEPYPKKELRELQKRWQTQLQLNEKMLEDIDESVFNKLQENDILFIDSTHIVKCDNDVHRLYLKILPNLPAGVIVHIHDIRLPQDYPRSWVVNKKYFWNEQYLLHMFLCFNDSYKILFASNYMKLKYYEEFSQSVIGLDEDGWPGSFWIKKIK